MSGPAITRFLTTTAPQFLTSIPKDYPKTCKTLLITSIALGILCAIKNAYLLITVGIFSPVKFMLMGFNPYFFVAMLLGGLILTEYNVKKAARTE